MDKKWGCHDDFVGNFGNDWICIFLLQNRSLSTSENVVMKFCE